MSLSKAADPGGLHTELDPDPTLQEKRIRPWKISLKIGKSTSHNTIFGFKAIFPKLHRFKHSKRENRHSYTNNNLLIIHGVIFAFCALCIITFRLLFSIRASLFITFISEGKLVGKQCMPAVNEIAEAYSGGDGRKGHVPYLPPSPPPDFQEGKQETKRNDKGEKE